MGDIPKDPLGVVQTGSPVTPASGGANDNPPPCLTCEGSGTSFGSTCPTCDGDGKYDPSKS